MSDRRFIISTRPAEKFGYLELDCCFDIRNVPLTEINEMEFRESDLEGIRAFDPDIVVFTSERGADIFFSRINKGLDKKERKFYGVGPATCARVESEGYNCISPEKRNSRGLGELLVSREADSRILLFRSGQANAVLDELLSSSGTRFMNVTAYYVVKLCNSNKEIFLEDSCFGVVFTSSMEAESFAELMGAGIEPFRSSGKRVFSIGDFTTATLKKLSLTVSEPEGNSDFRTLMENICSQYCEEKS